jgi:hypothetical protein
MEKISFLPQNSNGQDLIISRAMDGHKLILNGRGTYSPPANESRLLGLDKRYVMTISKKRDSVVRICVFIGDPRGIRTSATGVRGQRRNH